MQKLLLTGANGFLGTHFYNQLKNAYHIIGLHHTTPNAAISESYAVDITDATALQNIVQKVQPDIIVHTAAISSIAQCETNEAYAYTVNVTAAVQLTTLAKQLGAAFIFCSTDLVFDGVKGNYTEQDVPNPINKYGEQKYIAEQKIIAANPNAILARLPLMIGKNNNGTAGVVAELQQKMQQNEPAYLFTNEYRSPALVQDVVAGLQLLLHQNDTGIFHIAGKQKLNRLQIAQYVTSTFYLKDLTLIATTHQEKGITNRPADVSLSIGKMEVLGYLPTSLL